MPIHLLVGHFSVPDFIVRFFAAGMDSPQDLIDLFRSVKKKVRPEVLAERVQALQEVDAHEALKGRSGGKGAVEPRQAASILTTINPSESRRVVSFPSFTLLRIFLVQ